MRTFGGVWSSDRQSPRTVPDAPPTPQSLANKFDHATGTEIGGVYRLKNAAALIDTLGLPKDASDARIVGAGWRNWGTDLADYLRGTFALILKDWHSGTLYAARDAFAQEPLYYTRTDGGWVFAETPPALRAFAPRAGTIDPVMVADFIMGHVTTRDTTFDPAIKRLPAASWMSVVGGEATIRRYWSPQSAPLQREQTDAVAQFRSLFDSSVAFHRRGAGKTASLVSGGMDSSAILGTLIAQGVSGDTILGLSRTYRQLPQWSDGQYIDVLKNAFDLDLREFPSETVNPLDQTEKILAITGEPVQSYGMAALLPLYDEARRAGASTIFDGAGGDEIVSFGYGRLNELARAGEWGKLWAEARVAKGIEGTNRTQLTMRYFVHLRYWQAVRWRLQRWQSSSTSEAPLSPLSADLAALVEPGRYDNPDPITRRDHDERMIQENVLSLPLQQYAQEMLMMVSRAHGVEGRMPFYDRDLAEFSLSLPSSQKMANGMTRAILRNAMQNRLPDSILKRRDKFDFSYAFAKGLLVDRAKLREIADPSDPQLSQFVDPAWLAALWDRVAGDIGTIDPYDTRALFRVAQLAIWLKMAKQ